MKKHREIDILIVEDNPHDLELAVLALKKNNLSDRIMIVRNGEEALNFLFRRKEFSKRDKQQTPGFILLDLKLPRINGLEVLKEIKSDPLLRKIPVVILSTSNEEKDLQQGYLLGANSYIIKPVDYQQFVQTILEIGQYWLDINKQPK